MATLTDTNAIVDDLIKNDSGVAANDALGATEVNICIAKAIEEYSKDKPYLKYDSKIGNSEYELALPSDWVSGFSVFREIEYPAGSQEKSVLDRNNYFVINEDTTSRTCDNSTSGASSVTASTASEANYFKDGEIVEVGDDNASETNWISSDGNSTTGVIALKNTTDNTYNSNPYIKKKDHMLIMQTAPLSSEYLVREYTIKHTLSDATDTTYTGDYYAICNLAASFCCLMTASIFAKKQDPTFTADSVDFGGKATSWTDLARVYREEYNRHMGKGDEVDVKAASAMVDMDAEYSWGRDFLFHKKRTR